MSKKDQNVNIETRIKKLKQKVRDIVGDSVQIEETGNCSPEIQEKFWESILAYEKGPYHQLFNLLIEAGVSLPPPEDLDDTQITLKLWELIQVFTLFGAYLYNTDHLNDRELYEVLWKDILREEGYFQPGNPDYTCHLDMIGSGSEEDIITNLKYYADEEERRRWAKEFPDDIVPDHEEKPFDRDRHLPKRDMWGASRDKN